MDIIKDLTQIFTNVLDIENVNLTKETTANDIDEWDSLTHVMLIVEIEKHFKIKFTSKEILSWKNIGEMIDSIKSKL